MAGISVGVNLLTVAYREITISGFGGLKILGYNTGGTATASDSYTVTLNGLSTITNNSISFSPTTNQPSYSFSNPTSSLSNTANYTLTTGSKAIHKSTATLTVTADGQTDKTATAQLVMGTFFTSITPTYSTSSYSTGGTFFALTFGSTDYWGQTLNLTWFPFYYVSNSNIEFPSNESADGSGARFYLRRDLFGNVTGNVTVAISDSEGIVGTYGANKAFNFTRTASWQTAGAATGSATYTTGNTAQYGIDINFVGGDVDWSDYLGNAVSTSFTDGRWAHENGGDVKLFNQSDLEFKIKYTHVSGSTSWYIRTSGGTAGTKDVILSGAFCRLRIPSTVATSCVVKVGFYTTADVLLYEQNVTMTINLV